MKQKSYNLAKMNCKICIIFGDIPELMNELDFDISEGMNYLVFLQKYNAIIGQLGLNVRLVSSNYYRHKHHTPVERRAELEKYFADKELHKEGLTKYCEDLKRSFIIDNKFLKTTFSQRVDVLNDTEKILGRRKKDIEKLRKTIDSLEYKIGGLNENNPDYAKFVVRQYNLKKELVRMEDSIRDFHKDVWDMSGQMEDSYRKSTVKFSEVDMESEIRKRLNDYFLQLNTNINDFISKFRAYLEWGEFRHDPEGLRNFMSTTTKLLSETVSIGVHNSIKLLPSDNISDLPGVKAIENTVESLKGMDNDVFNQ